MTVWDRLDDRITSLIDRMPKWLAGLITALSLGGLAYLAVAWNGANPT